MSEAVSAAKKAARTKHTHVVLGVFRRDLVFIGSAESEEEAEVIAEAGVLESKFSTTIVLETAGVFSEGAVNWANPDGVRHEPAQGAPLNPEAEEQEVETSAESGAPAVSKTDLSAAAAEEQIKSGAAVDTGEPDKTQHQRSGGDTNKTSAFDGKKKS